MLAPSVQRDQNVLVPQMDQFRAFPDNTAMQHLLTVHGVRQAIYVQKHIVSHQGARKIVFVTLLNMSLKVRKRYQIEVMRKAIKYATY